MSKAAVVWWSGTGNTTEMAEAIKEGLEKGGATVEMFEVDAFDVDDLDQFDRFAFGCPAMGAEELETGEFQPMWDSAIDQLGDKPVALFGSYGWGSGEWMETWNDDAEDAGLKVVGTVIAQESPDSESREACVELGEALAKA